LEDKYKKIKNLKTNFMSKKIVFNQEKNALYFHNNDIQYRIDFMDFKRSQENFNSHYQLVDGLEQNLIIIFTDIDRIERKLKVINKAFNKINLKFDNGTISLVIHFEIKEFVLMIDENGFLCLALDLERISFKEIEAIKNPGFDFIDINNADIDEINLFAQSIFGKIQNKYKQFNFILKLDKMSFHRPNNNTIDSF
jgi:hypothetical protein